MSVQPGADRLSIGEFERQIRGQLVPLSTRLSYFFTGLNLPEDDIREYLEEPVMSLSPDLTARLPQLAIVLVPYLERVAPADGDEAAVEAWICFKEPSSNRISSARYQADDLTLLVFALKDQDVAEYHYRLFHALAAVAEEVSSEELHDQFYHVVRDELSAGAHGEVDEESWELKQSLLRRQRNMRRKTKGLARYAQQAMIDTLTLYMHGICCDIDIETGPRQLASRHMRRRLELLQSAYPPPEGYAVFPEDVDTGEGS